MLLHALSIQCLQAPHRQIVAIMLVLPLLSTLFGLSSVLYFLLIWFPGAIKRPITASASDKDEVNVLLVIAHPDDECMFFSPTLYAFRKQPNVNVTILCLTTGNHDDQGEIRTKELVEAAAEFGVYPNQVIIVNSQDLPDDPKKIWNPALVAKTVKPIIVGGKIDAVFTFDSRGVSGHENHIAAYIGTKHLLMTDQQFKLNPVHLYSLNSISLVRKYSGIADTIFAVGQALASKNDIVFISGLEGYQVGRQAMARHQSQLVWFRKLYLIFSRYMFINTFSKQAVRVSARNLSTTTARKDLLKDLYLKEIRNYKPEPIAKSEVSTKTFAVPKTPEAPKLDVDLAKDLEAYEKGQLLSN
ncbi:hypothetical protein EV182_003423 [Spiromyces aspiralis]|uniref:Uncharacterized protein n=1 Tax=Spiromyces aspiralis TaxID=68401 RepID=A0ACC1HCU1_9FUNG|nr:hypothetical protein EV182_003423 [Spiromyces aspiralis]